MHVTILTVAGLTVMWIFPILQLVIAAAGRKNGAAAESSETSLPIRHFFLLVPAMNEGRVIGETVRNLLDVKAADAQVSVLVINDASTDDTLQKLQEVHNRRLIVLNRKLPNAQLGKGEALNNAYNQVCDYVRKHDLDPRQVVVGIIDADGRCSQNLLQEVQKYMQDPQVAAVQARVKIRNVDTFWGIVQNMEFSQMVNATQNIRDRLGSVALGGNGQFTRLSSLQTLGEKPWTGCLVEDLDLGVRVHQKSGTIRYTPDAYVTQQAVTKTRKLLRQRTRWSQGNIQCLPYVPSIAKSGKLKKRAKADMVFYLVIGLIGVLGSAATAYGAYLLVTHPAVQDLPDVALLAAALLLPGAVWALLYKKDNPGTTWSTTAKLTIGYVGLVVVSLVSVLRAWYRQLRHKSSWEKTERIAETAQ